MSRYGHGQDRVRSQAQAAPVGQILGASNPKAIPDSYTVVLKEHAFASAGALAAKYEGQVEHAYQHVLQGFAGTMSREAAQKLAAEPGVP